MTPKKFQARKNSETFYGTFCEGTLEWVNDGYHSTKSYDVLKK